MSLYRGSNDSTLVSGEIVATPSDITAAFNDATAAKNAAEAAQAAAEAALDNFDDRYLGAKTTDPTVDNDGNALIDGALYYNTDDQMTRVYDLSAGTWSNLKPTPAEQTNINALAPFVSEVDTVSNNISDVQTVSDDISNVISVSGIIDNVNTVAGVSTDVNLLASYTTELTALSPITSDISTVASISSEVTDVSQSSDAVDIIATDLAGAGFDYDLGTITASTDGVLGTPDGYIITLFNIRDDIETVSGISSDVSSVADIDSNVTTVAGVASDVTTVAGVTADISTVAGISTDVTAVSGISSDVTNVSDAIGGDPAGASLVSYDNATSGLTATDVQDAVDELESEKASLAGGNTFTGTQDVTGDVNIDGTVDCGTIV